MVQEAPSKLLLSMWLSTGTGPASVEWGDVPHVQLAGDVRGRLPSPLLAKLGLFSGNVLEQGICPCCCPQCVLLSTHGARDVSRGTGGSVG